MMMGTTTSSSSSSNSSNLNLNLNPNPNHHHVFTAAQWEELEQQALIYKYMVSGVPVPTDLILSVRRSLFNSTSSSSSLSNQHPLGVWEGSFQYNQLYGYGRKIDLEPGRCRRTDGKKWRCSKEAYPDSKYCERHMHRGRNRSRKPVEFSSSSSSSTTSASSSSTLNVSSSPSTTISKSLDTYPQFSSNQTNFMDSPAYSHQTLKDYRYLQGMKNFGEDERTGAYFHLNDPYTNTQKISSSDHHHHNYSHFNFQNLKEQQNKEDEETQGQHCFVMGTDFVKSSEGLATKSSIQFDRKADESASKQPFHHFFAPPKNTQDHAWAEIDQQQNHHLINQPKSPLSTQDLFQSKPRPYPISLYPESLT